MSLDEQVVEELRHGLNSFLKKHSSALQLYHSQATEGAEHSSSLAPWTLPSSDRADGAELNIASQFRLKQMVESARLHSPRFSSAPPQSPRQSLIQPHPVASPMISPLSPGFRNDLSSTIEHRLWQQEMMQIQSIWTNLARYAYSEVLDILMEWRRITTVASSTNPPIQVCNWFVGSMLMHIMREVLKNPVDKHDTPIISKTVQVNLMELCMEQMNQSMGVERPNSEASFFSSFKASTTSGLAKKKKLEQQAMFVFELRNHEIWREILGLLSLHGVSMITARFQQEYKNMTKGATVPMKQHIILNLEFIHMNVGSDQMSSSQLRSRVQEVMDFLRVFQSLLLSSNKNAIRNTGLQVLSKILRSEMSRHSSSDYKFYTIPFPTWYDLLFEYHTLASKLTSKKDLATHAWDLRIATLAMLHMDQFQSTWKEDAQNLLRYHYLHRDINSLRCIVFLIRHILKRMHALNSAVSPTSSAIMNTRGISPSLIEKDLMELINTAQAWCFSIPKLKHAQLKDFLALTLPLLVDLSVSIASYNMNYTIQSHIRQLLFETDSLFDEKKLIGLCSIQAIFDAIGGSTKSLGFDASGNNSSSNSKSDDGSFLSPLSSNLKRSNSCMAFNEAVLMENKHLLGENVGSLLVECNTFFGRESMLKSGSHSSSSPPTSRLSMIVLGSSCNAEPSTKQLSESKHTLGMEIFKVVIQCLRSFYHSIDLSQQQKMMILANCCIHANEGIRGETHELLRCIVHQQEDELVIIVKGFTEYILHISDDEEGALLVYCDLVRDLIEIVTENLFGKDLYAIQQAFLQVEVMCLHLLCGLNPTIRMASLHLLTNVRLQRSRLYSWKRKVQGDTTSSNGDCNRSERDWNQGLSLLDVIDGIQDELQSMFCFTSLDYQHAHEAGGVVPWLAAMPSNPTSSIGFPWSHCLARVFFHAVNMCPVITRRAWEGMNEKAIQFEPVLPTTTTIIGGGGGVTSMESTTTSSLLQLHRWTNCAVFVCATAFPDDSDETDVDPDDAMTLSSIELFFKRLVRYVKSPSTSQRCAVALALSATHASVHASLLHCLTQQEVEAFLHAAPSFEKQGRELYYTVQLAPFVATLGSTASKKMTKAQRMKHIEVTGQLHAQWAIGRIYRTMLANLDYETWTNEVTRKRIFAFIDAMHALLRHLPDSLNGKWSPILFIMRQDFCATLQSVLHQCHVTSMEMGLDKGRRQAWYLTLMEWCTDLSFSSDAFTSRLIETGMNEFWAQQGYAIIGAPTGAAALLLSAASSQIYHWPNEDGCLHAGSDALTGSSSRIPFPTMESATAFLHYLRARAVYPTLATLCIGPLLHDSMDEMKKYLFPLLDNVLSVCTIESSHLKTVQHFARRGLYAVLQSNVELLPYYFTKCLSLTQTHSSTDLLSEQYVCVLSMLSDELHHEMTSQALLPDLLLMGMLHLGHENAANRMNICKLMEMLVQTTSLQHAKDTKMYHPGYVTTSSLTSWLVTDQVTLRIQELLSMRLAACFGNLSYVVLSKILTHVMVSSPRLQEHLLQCAIPWMKNLRFHEHSSKSWLQFLHLLFEITNDQQTIHRHSSGNSVHFPFHSFKRLWQTLAMSHDAINLHSLVEFLFQKQDVEARCTCKLVLWWIVQCSDETYYQVLSSVFVCIKFEDNHENMVKNSCRAITLLADLTFRYATTSAREEANHKMHEFFIPFTHKTLNIIYLCLFPRSVLSPKKSMLSLIQPSELLHHCVVLMENMCFHLPRYGREIIEALKYLIEAHEVASTSASDATSHPNNMQRDFFTIVKELSTFLDASERKEWAYECTKWFTPCHVSVQEREVAMFSMQIYQVIVPDFNGMICLRFLSNIHTSLDTFNTNDVEHLAFMKQMLQCLTKLVTLMPPSKLVMYPQLLWVNMEIMDDHGRHRDSMELYQVSLELVKILITKTSFTLPIVQDVILARKPSRWNQDPTQACGGYLQKVLFHGLSHQQTYATACECIAHLILAPCHPSLNGKSSHKLVLSTMALLPWLCMVWSTSEPGQEVGNVSKKHSVKDTGKDLAYMWEVEREKEVSAALLRYSKDQFASMESFLCYVLPPMMRFMQHKMIDYTTLYRLFFDVLAGDCKAIFSSTIFILQHVVSSMKSMGPSRNDSNIILLNILNNIMKQSNEDKHSWKLILRTLSTSLQTASPVVPISLDELPKESKIEEPETVSSPSSRQNSGIESYQSDVTENQMEESSHVSDVKGIEISSIDKYRLDLEERMNNNLKSSLSQHRSPDRPLSSSLRILGSRMSPGM